jgi:PKD repeat protein
VSSSIGGYEQNPDSYISQSIDQFTTLLTSLTTVDQKYLNANQSLQNLLTELKTKIASLPATDKQKIAEYLQANIFADFQGLTSFKEVKERPSTLFGLIISNAYAQDYLANFEAYLTRQMHELSVGSIRLLGASFVAIGGIGAKTLTGVWKLAGYASIAIGLALLISRAQGAQDILNNIHNIDPGSLSLKVPASILANQEASFTIKGRAIPLDSLASSSLLINQTISESNNTNLELSKINSELSSINANLTLLGFSSQVEQLPLLYFPQASFPVVLSPSYITNVQIISSDDGTATIKTYSVSGNNLLVTFNSRKTQNAKLRVHYENTELGITKDINTVITIIADGPKAVINSTVNNLTVNFDSTVPDDPDVTGLTYLWDFGDGKTATTSSKTFSHTYAAEGFYNVSLIVSNSSGATDSANASVVIINSIDDSGNIRIEYRKLDLDVNFNVSYFDITQENLIYYWDFGDGLIETTTVSFVDHHYKESGNYTTHLTIKQRAEGTEFILNDVSVDNVEVYAPKLVILSQPEFMTPRGASWSYTIQCNVGEKVFLDSTIYNFKTGIQLNTENVYTCTGVGEVAVGVNTNSSTHTITCTPKSFSCPYTFITQIWPSFACGVIDNENKITYKSDWVYALPHDVDYRIPGC